MRVPDRARKSVLWGSAAVAGVIDSQLPAHPTGVALAFGIVIGLGNALIVVIAIVWGVRWLRTQRPSRRGRDLDADR
jgi:hypothetical protein